MLYAASISTPANTSASAPLSSRIIMTPGLIYHVELYFPPGSCGLLHVQLFDSAYQVCPASPGESLCGDNVLLRYDEMYMHGEAPFIVEVKTWNTDTEYDHGCELRIALVSKEEYIARFMPSMQTGMVEEVLAKVEGEQAAKKEKALAALRSRLRYFGE